MNANAAPLGAAPDCFDDLDNRSPSILADTSQRPLAAERAEIDIALELWAARMIARTILFAEGKLALHPAVDRSWADAVDAGLVDEFGPDEVQSAMSLAFRAVRC